jgi:NitT/TauT family transport system substrate-binding protein
MRARAVPTTIAAAVAVAALAACSSQPATSASEGPAEREVAKVTWVSPNATPDFTSGTSIYAVGQKYGFFKEQGLDVTYNFANGSTAALQAVASGSADFTASDAASLVPASEKGTPVMGIADLVSTYTWRMATLPGSKLDAGDLKGKSIGVISLTSGSYPYTQAFLREEGIAEADVKIVPVGNGVSAGEALKNGSVDVVALYTTPYAQLEALGYKFRYIPNPSSMKNLFGTLWLTTKDHLATKAEKDVTTRFLRAAFQSLLFSSTNPKAALNAGYEIFPQLVAAGKTKEETTPKDLVSVKTWLSSCVPGTATGPTSDWKDWGQMSKSRWDGMIDYLVASKAIDRPVPLKQFWDGSLIEKANDFDAAAVIKLAKKAK